MTNSRANEGTQTAALSLLPCPFCGGTPTVDASQYMSKKGGGGEPLYWSVECATDTCPALLAVQGRTQEAAIAAWNHRKPEAR